MRFAAGLISGMALVGVALVAASANSRVSRTNLAQLERWADGKLVQLDTNMPGEALGKTRGVYLEGYGAVFTIEVDPIPYAAVSPFRPSYTDAEIAKLRTQKQGRIELLKKKMVETLVAMAQNLEGVSQNEQIVLAVTIPYWPWEKANGLPQQILIQASKSALLNPANLTSSLKIQEF